MASLLGRIVSAASGAFNGMQAGWNGGGNAIDAYNPQTWDSYASRVSRYNQNWGYFDGSIFGVLLGQVNAVKGANSLYEFIRMIYNPVPPLVNLNTAKIYGGVLDLETGTEGAIPLDGTDERLAQAVMQLWRTSNWNLHKNLFVRHGSIYGDNFIKLVSDERRQQICMELLDPYKVKAFHRDYSGEIDYIEIEYVVPESAWNKTRYEYKEIITPEAFEYYKDGDLYDYDKGVYGAGGKKANPYGFVPVSQAQDSAIGYQSGACCFHDGRNTINELNDLASLLDDTVRNAVKMPVIATGVQTGDTIDLKVTSRDKVPIIKLSKVDAKVVPLNYPVDIAGAQAVVDSIYAELERRYPQLTLARMREGQTPSGVAVHMLWGDASDRIQETAGNYDDALCRAQAMGIAMGAYHAYKGYQGFKVTDYEAGTLTHTIKARSMFDETLDLQSQINTLAMVSSQPPPIQRLMLQKLDVDETTIEEIVSAAEEQDAQDMANAARGMQSTLNGEADKPPTREELAKKQAAAIAKKNQAATNSG